MAIPDYQQTRLTNLQKNLNEGMKLIGELERAISFADGPIAKMRYNADLEHIRNLTNQWENEYQSLKKQLAGSDTVVDKALDNIGSAIDSARAQVINITNIYNQDNSITYGNRQQAGGNATMTTGNNFSISGNNNTVSNVNIGSTLTNVQQQIGNSPNLAEDQKKALESLVTQLKAELEKSKPEHQEAATNVAKNLDSLVQEADKPERDDEVVELKGNRLKKAAENIAGALPAVGTIVTKILGIITGVPTS